MASTNEVIGLGASLSAEAVLNELKRIGVGGEQAAKSLMASLAKAERQNAAAAKKIANDLKQAGEAGSKAFDAATGSATNGINKAAKALGPLGGVLSRISPEAGAAASSIAGLTGAMEGFEASGFIPAITSSLPILGILGVALGSAAGVMGDYTRATREAERAQVSFKAALAPLDAAIASAREEQALLNAAIDSGQAKEYLVVADLSAKADAKEAEATKELRAEKDALMQSLAVMSNMESGRGLDAQDRIKDIDREVGAVHAQANEYAKLSVTNATTRKFIDSLSVAEKSHAKASEKATDSLAKFNAEMAASDRLAADNVNTYSSVIEQLNELANADIRASASKEEQARLSHESALQQIADLKAQGLAVTSEIGARETVEQEARAASLAETAKYYEEVSAFRRAAADADEQEALATASSIAAANEQALQTRLSGAQQLNSSLSALGDQLLQSTIDNADLSTAAGRKAAKKAWDTQQALAIATATLDAALSVAAAATLPPPASFIAMAAAGIAAIATVAAVASSPAPSFHQGYAPDEMTARVLKTEAVLNPTATASLGTSTISAMNAGQSASARPQSAMNVWKHKVFRPFIKDFLNTPNALTNALNAGGAVGHRTNRRGTNG